MRGLWQILYNTFGAASLAGIKGYSVRIPEYLNNKLAGIK